MVFLEISKNPQENTCARVSFLIKLPQVCNFIKKETLTQVFSCEFYEISTNTFFTEHFWWLLLWTLPSRKLSIVNLIFLSSEFKCSCISLIS